MTLVLGVHRFAEALARLQDRPQTLLRATRIDLNRARLGELMALPGVGRARAQAIVLHRVRHGPFTHREQLIEVDGFGATTFAGVRDYLLDPAPPSAAVREAVPQRGPPR